MRNYPNPLDLSHLRVQPLDSRNSMSRIEEVLVDPASPPPSLSPNQASAIKRCAAHIQSAIKRQSSIMLLYGAHLIKNGAHRLITHMIERGWVTHLATNGAGIIHDWEFAFLGRSTESVRANVATGTFGAWDETGRNIHLALLRGAIDGHGFGQSMGRLVQEDGIVLPDPAELQGLLQSEPAHPLTPARSDLLLAMRTHSLNPGPHPVPHPWKDTCVLGQAWKHRVPLTVHPGIGYDIISNHPMFNGAALGRAAAIDFKLFCAAVEHLDHGVVLSVGSAIMAPQVFEKSLSCVNNLRLAAGRSIVQNHQIHVVDLSDGGDWDWTQGEPPATSPAYYLRFCKSFSRMGGAMHYIQCDNVAFLHHLCHLLSRPESCP